MAASLKQHSGNGSPREIAQEHGLYVWGERGLLASLDLARDEIDAIRPAILVLHAAPSSLVRDLRIAVSRVRQRHPYARVWVGCGMDGTVGEWREARRTDEQVIAPLRAVAELCEQHAVEVIVWNGESQWKDQPHDKRTLAEIEALADAAGRAVVKAAPNVVHWLSSFDQPTLHGALRAFLRGFTRWVSAYTGQAYVAVKGGAARGSLDRRLDAARRSQELAERAGFLPDDVEDEDTHGDVDRVPTIQVHQTHLADLVRAGLALPMLLLWSAPLVAEDGRMDEVGLRAMRFVAVLRRAGVRSVEEWQRAKGLKPDGIVGPLTLASAGIA